MSGPARIGVIFRKTIGWRGGVVGLATVLSACANNGSLDLDEIATGALEAVPASAVALTSGHLTPKGTPTEVYARIARGAHACWLGGPGGLRKTHKFHAVATPRVDGKGGDSKIIIYKRPSKKSDDEKEIRKGLQAFKIRIYPQGASAAVEARNIKLPKEMGERMVADTHRWAAGEEGCIKGGLTDGWEADASAAAKKKPR